MAHYVAWRQSHLFELSGVPGTQNQPSALWVGLDVVDEVLELVNTFSMIVCVHIDIWCIPMSPLKTINWTKISFLSVV